MVTSQQLGYLAAVQIPCQYVSYPSSAHVGNHSLSSVAFYGQSLPTVLQASQNVHQGGYYASGLSAPLEVEAVFSNGFDVPGITFQYCPQADVTGYDLQYAAVPSPTGVPLSPSLHGALEALHAAQASASAQELVASEPPLFTPVAPDGLPSMAIFRMLGLPPPLAPTTDCPTPPRAYSPPLPLTGSEFSSTCTEGYVDRNSHSSSVAFSERFSSVSSNVATTEPFSMEAEFTAATLGARCSDAGSGEGALSEHGNAKPGRASGGSSSRQGTNDGTFPARHSASGGRKAGVRTTVTIAKPFSISDEFLPDDIAKDPISQSRQRAELGTNAVSSTFAGVDRRAGSRTMTPSSVRCKVDQRDCYGSGSSSRMPTAMPAYVVPQQQAVRDYMYPGHTVSSSGNALYYTGGGGQVTDPATLALYQAAKARVAGPFSSSYTGIWRRA